RLLQALGPEGGLLRMAKEARNAAMAKELLSAGFLETPVESPGVVEPLPEARREMKAGTGEGRDEPGRHLGGGFLLVPIDDEDALASLQQMPGQQGAREPLADDEEIGFHDSVSSGKELAGGRNHPPVCHSLPLCFGVFARLGKG